MSQETNEPIIPRAQKTYRRKLDEFVFLPNCNKFLHKATGLRWLAEYVDQCVRPVGLPGRGRRQMRPSDWLRKQAGR